MFYRLTYEAPYKPNSAVWPNLDRKNLIHTIYQLNQTYHLGVITIEAHEPTRYFLRYDRLENVWDMCRHGNGRSTYYGRSYKTLAGALNRLDKLAAPVPHQDLADPRECLTTHGTMDTGR